MQGRVSATGVTRTAVSGGAEYSRLGRVTALARHHRHARLSITRVSASRSSQHHARLSITLVSASRSSQHHAHLSITLVTSATHVTGGWDSLRSSTAFERSANSALLSARPRQFARLRAALLETLFEGFSATLTPLSLRTLRCLVEAEQAVTAPAGGGEPAAGVRDA